MMILRGRTWVPAGGRRNQILLTSFLYCTHGIDGAINLRAEKTKIIILCGPTAIGKTSTAIALCQALKGEIINADSMQVYRHMNIGTAKPTPQEKRLVPHHMVDIVDPDEDFDAAKFSGQARKIIDELKERQVMPVVAGGTGLYIKALVHGLFEMMPSDGKIRERLRETAEKHGSSFLHDQLKVMDSETAAKIHPNDLVRIIRAIEVYRISGKPISQFQKEHRFSNEPYETLKIGLHMERPDLYRRIDLRVDAMIEEGLVEEVKGLLAKGYTKDLKSMQSLGYRHMADFLGGITNWRETVRLLKRDTRRYAKRQMTWFRKDGAVIWKKTDEIDEIIQMTAGFLGNG